MSGQIQQQNKDNDQSGPATQFQIQSDGESTLKFVDQRPGAVAQRKLQEIANNSPRLNQVAQLQSMMDNRSNKEQQPIQRQENNTGLPDNLKSGMEKLSGHSLDDVRVHRNSDKPAQLQAHAYAQGTDIHLGPGQEKHLPHELGHVVQQKEGRVKPTIQMKGKVNVNDDNGLEREADIMGAKAAYLGKKINQPEQIQSVNQEDSLQLKSSNYSVLQMANANDVQVKAAGMRLRNAESIANVDGARDNKLAELKQIGMGSEEEKQAIRDKRKEQKSTVDGTIGSDVSTTNPKEISGEKKLASIPEDEISDSTYVKDDLATIQWVTKLAREAGASGKGYEDAWFVNKEGREFFKGDQITDWKSVQARQLRIPNWRDYLSNAYVERHLMKFIGGGHAFIPMEAHRKVMGMNLGFNFEGWGNKDQFITPIDEANVISDDAQNAEGIKTLEKVCGLPEASWATNADKQVARYFVPSTSIGPPKSEEEAKFQVEMVTGLEYGSHPDFWNAGGITSGGLSEAKIKAVDRDTLLLKNKSK